MTPYCMTEVFSRDELLLYSYVTRLVEEVPDKPPVPYAAGRPLVWRCHELAHALVRHLKECRQDLLGDFLDAIAVVDGRFGSVEHSWIAYLRRDPQARSLRILDPYAVGRLPQVQLLDTSYGVRSLAECYKPSHLPRTDRCAVHENHLLNLWRAVAREEL